MPRLIADYQRTVAQAAFDAGADLILGHHAHCRRPLRFLAARRAFYSLNNFIMSSSPKVTTKAVTSVAAMQLVQKRTAIMCAEAVPWRCHRSLVADALSVRGIPAVEILSESSYRMHKLTPFARVEGTHISYPPKQATLSL